MEPPNKVAGVLAIAGVASSHPRNLSQKEKSKKIMILLNKIFVDLIGRKSKIITYPKSARK